MTNLDDRQTCTACQLVLYSCLHANKTNRPQVKRKPDLLPNKYKFPNLQLNTVVGSTVEFHSFLTQAVNDAAVKHDANLNAWTGALSLTSPVLPIKRLGNGKCNGRVKNNPHQRKQDSPASLEKLQKFQSLLNE